MGRIISATDTVLDKRVAIKILPTMTISDTAVIRFHQEAKAVSKLNHQHIVQVLDFGFASSTGEPYLVMEHVAGETLDDLIEKNQKLPLRTAIELAKQMCSGIQHAHSNKIIHRDLKPGNIMIDENKDVKILDFGLAKIVDQENVDWRLTKPGQAMGSPLYMSPEQLRGEEVDGRSDIYSLGLVIFKMVTGGVPFEGENLMKILMGRMEGAPPALPPDEDNPLLREAFNSVLERTLQPNRDDRPATMNELKEELEELSSVVDVKEQPVEAPAWYQSKRNIAMLVSTAIIAVLGIFGIAALMHNQRVTSVDAREPGDELGVRRAIENVPIKDKKRTLKITNNSPSNYGFVWEHNEWLAQSGVVDKDLEGLTNVTALSLLGNKHITVNGIKHLTSLPLKSLVLRETHLGDEIIPYINEMKQLERLDLRHTSVTDKGIRDLEFSPNIRYLCLSYCTGVTNASIPILVKVFPNLDDLLLSTTGVNAKGLRLLKPLKLQRIVVTGLNLNDDDVDVLVDLGIPDITLESNPITDKAIDKLKKIPNLTHLSVEFCKTISDAKLAELKELNPQMKITYPKKPQVEVMDKAKYLFEKEPDSFNASN